SGRVVDRVGVDPPAGVGGVPIFGAAGQGVLDASLLREPEVAALADHPALQVTRVDAHRVVGLVSHVGVRLGGRLDIGADAAVVEQVDGCRQDRLDQLVGGYLLGLDGQGFAGLG